METSRDDVANNAVSIFRSRRCNCAESVLLTMARHRGRKSSFIPKIATPFGGGIARTGSVCGCVSGALMHIGLEFGRMEGKGDVEKVYTVASSFLGAFERRFGSLTCYELIGCDLRTPEGRKCQEELRESRCVKFVKGAVEILLNLEKQAIK